MTDTPHHLAEYLDMLRASASEANAISAGRVARNSDAHLGNLFNMIEPTEAILEQAGVVREKFEELASLVGDLFSTVRTPDTIEAARKAALDAIDGLELLVREARPSAVTRGLGLA